MINLKEALIPVGRPNRHGIIINPTKITIHNTSNANPGADANAHSNFVRNTGYYIITDSAGNQRKNWVSWHFSVDDKRAIQHLPNNEKAIHAGAQGNNSSVAIEICMHAGIDQAAANNRAAQLVALLCHDLSIPVAGVVTHKYWTNKNCPQLLLASWDNFKTKVLMYYDGLSVANIVASRSLKSVDEVAVPAFLGPLCWIESSTEEMDALSVGAPGLPGEVQTGFNNQFLSRGEVGLPVIGGDSSRRENHVFLHHQNLSIYFNKERKLALYTACNFDKLALIETVRRSNAFRNDMSIDASFQLGDGFYKSKTLDINRSQNYFDRGHIIARRYNQWGETIEEARAGERDTYYFTAIHPQVKELNQDEWESLESFIIERGNLDVNRVSIISGTFLKKDDPVATYIDSYYQDEKMIQIPKLFWKIVYYEVNQELRKIGFLMSQVRRLKELPFVEFSGVERMLPDPFEELLDPLKTYVINTTLIEEHTGLVFAGAKELYLETEPLEVVINDNETHPGFIERVSGNILRYI